MFDFYLESTIKNSKLTKNTCCFFDEISLGCSKKWEENSKIGLLEDLCYLVGAKIAGYRVFQTITISNFDPTFASLIIQISNLARMTQSNLKSHIQG